MDFLCTKCLIIIVRVLVTREKHVFVLSGNFVDFDVIQQSCVVLDGCFLLILHTKIQRFT